MSTLCDLETFPAEPTTPALTPFQVRLVDGAVADLSSLGCDDLLQLQWEQETAFAERIKKSPRSSPERAAVTRRAYETVCTILGQLSRLSGHSEFAMGMDRRYSQYVLRHLARLRRSRIDGGLFEIGFGSGLLLEVAASYGYRVGGLEVAEQLYDEVCLKTSAAHRGNLLLGGFVGHPGLEPLRNSFSVAYWNDVFEHIPVDEISDYLGEICDLLLPGGVLITITPNWHMRPSDVTANRLPPRSEAVGFHLKEYTLGEVRQLLLSAGFSSVATPWFVGKSRMYGVSTAGTTRLKCCLEPALELLPYRIAVQMCRRFGLCCTVATKGRGNA